MLGSKVVEPSNCCGFSHWRPDALALREPMELRAEKCAGAQFHYLLDGKPAGVACVQLDESLGCRLFGRPERPAVCRSLRPGPAMCGANREEALKGLAWLEVMTAPAPAPAPAAA